MAGSLENAKLKDIEVYLKDKYPDLVCIGSREYTKTCILYEKKHKRGKFPKILRRTDANYKMLDILTHPSFNPDGAPKETGGFLPDLEPEQIHPMSLVNKAIDCAFFIDDIFNMCYDSKVLPKKVYARLREMKRIAKGYSK